MMVSVVVMEVGVGDGVCGGDEGRVGDGVCGGDGGRGG